MSENYLTEAFKEMKGLNEELFDFDKEGAEKLKKFMDGDDTDVFVTVIDPDVEEEEDLKSSYEGMAVLQCPICKSTMFKDPADVNIIEGESLANIGEPCPMCLNDDGFEVVGEICACAHESESDLANDFVEVEGEDGFFDEDEIDFNEACKITEEDEEAWAEEEEYWDDEGDVDYIKDALGGDIKSVDLVIIPDEPELEENGEHIGYKVTYADGHEDWVQTVAERVFTWELTDEQKAKAKPYIDESLNEDTVKTKSGKWTNKGKEGTHGTFKTKKAADAQRRAMYANGFEEELNESSERDDIDADADDKKEKAKKTFMRKKDDADSDKDYKLKKAGMKEPRQLKEESNIAKLKRAYPELDFSKYSKEESISSNKKEYISGECDLDIGPKDILISKIDGTKHKIMKPLDDSVRVMNLSDNHIGHISNDIINSHNFYVEEVCEDCIELTDSEYVFDETDGNIHADIRGEVGDYVKIHFVDDNDDKVYEYRILDVEGDDNYSTTLEYVGEAEESLNEDFKKVDIETEDTKMSMTSEEGGKVTVTTEPTHHNEEEIETTEEGVETIKPVSDEMKDEIMADETTEDEGEEEEEEEVDIDEFDEESFDELGESYFKNVYDNVDSYKTTTAKINGNKLILEGIITFSSGKQAKTNFLFEASHKTARGKLKFIGDNKQITESKNSFTITATVDSKKLLTEALTYNYKVKGYKDRIYGTVRK